MIHKFNKSFQFYNLFFILSIDFSYIRVGFTDFGLMELIK